MERVDSGDTGSEAEPEPEADDRLQGPRPKQNPKRGPSQKPRTALRGRERGRPPTSATDTEVGARSGSFMGFDGVFGEDGSQVRNRRAAENLGILRVS